MLIFLKSFKKIGRETKNISVEEDDFEILR